PLLEAAQLLLGLVELHRRARELLREELRLVPGFTGAVARHELIELPDIIVRHLGRRLGIGVFHEHRDDALLRDRDAGRSREMLERVVARAVSIVLLAAAVVTE